MLIVRVIRDNPNTFLNLMLLLGLAAVFASLLSSCRLRLLLMVIDESIKHLKDQLIPDCI